MARTKPKPKPATGRARVTRPLSPGDVGEFEEADVADLAVWPGSGEEPVAPGAAGRPAGVPVYDDSPEAVEARMRHDAEHHPDPEVRAALRLMLDGPQEGELGPVEEIGDGFFRAPAVAQGLGRAVAAFRKAHGLTQQELARRLRVHQSQIFRLERGQHTPTLETLVRVARELGLTMLVRVGPEGATMEVLDQDLPERSGAGAAGEARRDAPRDADA
jgi:transcriptional regulator with XRE-family HTH domain